MPINGTDAANAIVARMDADGVFDAIEDPALRAETRAKIAEGLQRHCIGLVDYLVANIVVKIPAGQRVDDLTGTQIGETADEQTGTIE